MFTHTGAFLFSPPRSRAKINWKIRPRGVEDDIDFEADGSNALPAEERNTKLASLRKALITLKRQQEAVICRLETEGAFTVPRTNSDPLILLEVELVDK